MEIVNFSHQLARCPDNETQKSYPEMYFDSWLMEAVWATFNGRLQRNVLMIT
jgi:hypothetical protein